MNITDERLHSKITCFISHLATSFTPPENPPYPSKNPEYPPNPTTAVDTEEKQMFNKENLEEETTNVDNQAREPFKPEKNLEAQSKFEEKTAADEKIDTLYEDNVMEMNAAQFSKLLDDCISNFRSEQGSK